MTEPTPDGTDSAGNPWAGRRFEPNPAAGDDGSAPPRLLEALHRFRMRELGQAQVLDALRDVRLLMPLLAERGDEGVGPHGRLVDTTQELAVVTVAAADGRTVLPAFTSVAAMQAWNPVARPIPVDARRVALAAAGEGNDLVIVDPTSPTEFGIRRPALKALALGVPWLPAADDPRVAAAIDRAASTELDVLAVRPTAGDPDARLVGPELAIALVLRNGLPREIVDGVTGRLAEAWADDPVIAERVDSIAMTLVRQSD